MTFGPVPFVILDLGKEFGYSDKGSLHYPVVAIEEKDADIIKYTEGEKRGFIEYKPNKGDK